MSMMTFLFYFITIIVSLYSTSIIFKIVGINTNSKKVKSVASDFCSLSIILFIFFILLATTYIGISTYGN